MGGRACVRCGPSPPHTTSNPIRVHQSFVCSADFGMLGQGIDFDAEHSLGSEMLLATIPGDGGSTIVHDMLAVQEGGWPLHRSATFIPYHPEWSTSVSYPPSLSLTKKLLWLKGPPLRFRTGHRVKLRTPLSVCLCRNFCLYRNFRKAINGNDCRFLK